MPEAGIKGRDKKLYLTDTVFLVHHSLIYLWLGLITSLSINLWDVIANQCVKFNDNLPAIEVSAWVNNDILQVRVDIIK